MNELTQETRKKYRILKVVQFFEMLTSCFMVVSLKLVMA